ncbi:hypothetical protein RhiirA1_537711 [Rhizophagus irregularis]|uniref:F-box domain-containing protein n=1 Tax=Rhizophagus irregularis TaxID=588596 RepID=A0A2N0RJM2_9GLOM|nr:hypothetical protein RhiirA1_537711 [Rhizophagus irregularis]
MACLKIFSGVFPEIMEEIIRYLRNDFSTLHSCILVNRLWCRLTIPLLWEDPFSIATRNFHFIEIYLHELNNDEKTKLINYRMKNDIIPLNTLFNYSSFIKKLNTKHIIYIIEIWIKEARSLTNKDRAGYKYKEYIFNTSLSNPNFIRNIKNLTLYVSYKNAVTTIEYLRIEQFLSLISSKCNLITSLDLRLDYNGNIINNDNNIFKKFTSDIIRSQNVIKKILFNGDSFDILDKLYLLKNLNNPNSLKTIIFNEINFTNITINIIEILEKLNGLESFHILNCKLNFDNIQQLINITKPFKLRSLFINMIVVNIEQFQLLLEVYGKYLENIKFGKLSDNESKEKLINLMIKYCPKIRYFELHKSVDDRNIHSTFNLIKNIGYNLNYLDINFPQNFNLCSIILQELGQILPKKLKYLNLNIIINLNDFKIFLNNSKNTFIEKLLILNNNSNDENDERILIYLKEHNMKIKRLNYLAYVKGNGVNLSCMKNEAKEFRSYGIQILNYNDSSIQFVDFVKEMY